MNAVEIEPAISELALQPFDAAEFPFMFLAAFGNKDTVKRLRTGNNNASEVPGGMLLRNTIHLAVCAARHRGRHAQGAARQPGHDEGQGHIQEARDLSKRTLHFKNERSRLTDINLADASARQIQCRNLLRRSLQRALYKDETGRRLSDPDMGPLFGGEAEPDDIESGTIYVLRSKSSHPFVGRAPRVDSQYWGDWRQGRDPHRCCRQGCH